MSLIGMDERLTLLDRRRPLDRFVSVDSKEKLIQSSYARNASHALDPAVSGTTETETMALRFGLAPRRIKIIWAEWVSLFVGLTFSLFLLLLLMIDYIAAGSAGTSHLLHTFGTQAIELNLFVAGFVWVSLRGTDYIVRALYRLARDGLKRAYRVIARVVRPEPSSPNGKNASISA